METFYAAFEFGAFSVAESLFPIGPWDEILLPVGPCTNKLIGESLIINYFLDYTQVRKGILNRILVAATVQRFPNMFFILFSNTTPTSVYISARAL